MQSADLRNGNNSAAAGGFDVSSDRRVSLQRKMRSRVQIIVDIRLQDTHEMSLVDDDDMVETLAPD